MPRWGPFSEIVPDLAEAGVAFVEIAGNDEIVVTAIGAEDNDAVPARARFLFDSMVISPSGKQRSVYLVSVDDLSESLQSLQEKNLTLEHVFDF